MNNAPLTEQQVSSSKERPGRMTAVMRTIAVGNDGPRIPRIAIVRGGRVIEERLVKADTVVTIGTGEGAMFTIQSAPPSFPLLQRANDGWWLHFVDGMSGRVATSTGIANLEQLRSAAYVANGTYRVKLSDDARGKIIVGRDTILFQLVPAPPAQPKPQLPLGVKAGLAGSMDWTLTIIAAMSFLLHFGIVGTMYSDWMDPVITVDHTVSLVDITPRNMGSLPAPEPSPHHVDPDPAPAPDPTPSPTPNPGPRNNNNNSNNTVAKNEPGPSRNQVSDDSAAKMAAEADKLQIGLIGSVKEGPALKKTLDKSDVPATDLSSAAEKQNGVTTDISDLTKKNAGGPVKQTTKTTLADVGGTKKKQGKDGTGPDTGPAGPTLVVDTLPLKSNLVVSDADAVIAKLRPRFRQCYQTGLNENASMSGKATMVVKIAPNGEVQSVSVGSNEGLSNGVTSCVASHLQKATFTGNGGVTTLNVPVTFVQSK